MFLDITPKVQVVITKINKWDYIKLNIFFTVIRTLNKMLIGWYDSLVECLCMNQEVIVRFLIRAQTQVAGSTPQ